MSTDNGNGASKADRPRRSSFTSSTFTTLFQRSNSTSQGTNSFPGPIATAAMNDQRRRLSINTLGLSGTSPTNPGPFSARRASLSTTNSDSIDESAVEEEDGTPGSRTTPNTPFTRHMSFGANAMRTMRPGAGGNSTNGRPPASSVNTPAARRRGSSIRVGPPTPPNSVASSLSSSWRGPPSSQASHVHSSRATSDNLSAARPDQGFNWSEQLRSRAESSVATGGRPSFSFGSGQPGSPPRGGSGSFSPPGASRHHDRAKSVSDMPYPPAQAATMKPKPDSRPKPDAFQERILKGDFYMD